MPAVRERLKVISGWWESHYEAWEIVEEKDVLLVNGMGIKTEHPGTAPKESDYPTRGQYIQANARWQLQMMKWNKENGQ